jgi:hypothetical protein
VAAPARLKPSRSEAKELEREKLEPSDVPPLVGSQRFAAAEVAPRNVDEDSPLLRLARARLGACAKSALPVVQEFRDPEIINDLPRPGVGRGGGRGP